MGFLNLKVRKWNWWCVKQTQRKMHRHAWKLTFSKMQNQQLFKKIIFLFLFKFHKISCNNPTEFSLRSMSYLYFELYWKNYAKRLLSKLLTQQLNLQIKKKTKEKFPFFYFILLQNHAIRKNDDKIKTKRNEIKLWLKAQIANRIRARNA